VLMAWILRKLRDFRTHADNISDIRLGWWWNVSLTIITPLVLGYMMYQLLVQNLTKQFDTPTGNYEGYSDAFIMFGGWSVAIGALVSGSGMRLRKWNKTEEKADDTSKGGKGWAVVRWWRGPWEGSLFGRIRCQYRLCSEKSKRKKLSLKGRIVYGRFRPFLA